MADMTEQSDLAGRLVETAARADFAARYPGDSWDDDLYVEEQAMAKHLITPVLAAVLPLLADEIEGRSARENGERFKAGVGFGMRDAAALLRDLAEQVAQ